MQDLMCQLFEEDWLEFILGSRDEEIKTWLSDIRTPQIQPVAYSDALWE